MPTVLGPAASLLLLLAQDPAGPTLIDLARQHGNISRSLLACGPLRDLRSLVEHNGLVFEGRVMHAESRLTADQRDLYTEYTFELLQVVQQRTAASASSTVPKSLPLVFAPPQSRPGFTPGPRVVVRAPVGRIEIEGFTITASANDLPIFKVGQHLVVFAHYDPRHNAWAVDLAGGFEIRADGVVPLTKELKADAYRSVHALSTAVQQLAAAKREPERP